MRSPLLVLAFALTGVGPAADPPYLAAVKERQEKAKTFEVTLGIERSYRQVAVPHRPGELVDYRGRGNAHLKVDDSRYWYRFELPTPTASGFQPAAREVSFDGSLRWEATDAPKAKPTRPGELEAVCTLDVFDDDRLPPAGRSEWAVEPFRLFLDLFRGTEPDSRYHLDKSDWLSLTPTGERERVGDRMCQVFDASGREPAGRPYERLWLDPAAGYVPRRIVQLNWAADRWVVGRRFEIEYRSDRRNGWVPSGWVDREPWPGGGEKTDTVTVDSFHLREAIPVDQFTIRFPPGSRVNRRWKDRGEWLLVAADGTLTPEPPPEPRESDAKPEEQAPPPAAELPSVGRTLAVVGVVGAVFAGLVVLLRRLAKQPEDKAEPDDRRNP
jgi:hypothetical protein